MQNNKILVAASHDGARAIHPMLPSSINAQITNEMSAAETRLHRMQYRAIFVGLYFEGSEMLQFVKKVRGGGMNVETPIVCFRPFNSMFRGASDALVEHAAKILGAQKYWDLSLAALSEFEQHQARKRVEKFLESETFAA